MMRRFAWWATTQVELLARQAGGLEDEGGGARQVLDRDAEDLRARHVHLVALARDAVRRQRLGGAAAGDVERAGERAVREDARGEDAPPVVLGRAEDDRAGAVAEEDAGGAVLPVEQAGEQLDAHHEDAARLARRDELVRDRDAVDEPGARRRDVEGRDLLRPELLLHVDGARGHGRVAADRADDDHVEVGDVEPRRLERTAARGGGHVAVHLVIGGDVAPADAGALGDPRVGGVDDLLELAVGDHPLGGVVARAQDATLGDGRGGHGRERFDDYYVELAVLVALTLRPL